MKLSKQLERGAEIDSDNGIGLLALAEKARALEAENESMRKRVVELEDEWGQERCELNDALNKLDAAVATLQREREAHNAEKRRLESRILELEQ